MKYWLAGEKYEDLLRQNTNIRGRGGKTGKRGNFLCIWGKKMSFLKKGGGAKKSYVEQIYVHHLM